MADDLEKRVKAAYRRHYEGTKDATEAWNKTLEEISPLDRDASEEEQDLRHRVGKILMKESRELDYELGDPYEVAIRTAIDDLKQDRVAEILGEEYRKTIEERKSEIRKKTKSAIPKGPKEWSPNKQRPLSEQEVESELERENENTSGEDLTLYVMFDEKGGLEGWKTDYPSYWPGHSGPTAQISVHENLDYDEIRTGISEAFEQLDWEEIEEELEREQEEGEDA